MFFFNNARAQCYHPVSQQRHYPPHYSEFFGRDNHLTILFTILFGLKTIKNSNSFELGNSKCVGKYVRLNNESEFLLFCFVFLSSCAVLRAGGGKKLTLANSSNSSSSFKMHATRQTNKNKLLRCRYCYGRSGRSTSVRFFAFVCLYVRQLVEFFFKPS